LHYHTCDSRIWFLVIYGLILKRITICICICCLTVLHVLNEILMTSISDAFLSISFHKFLTSRFAIFSSPSDPSTTLPRIAVGVTYTTDETARQPLPFMRFVRIRITLIIFVNSFELLDLINSNIRAYNIYILLDILWTVDDQPIYYRNRKDMINIHYSYNYIQRKRQSYHQSCRVSRTLRKKLRHFLPCNTGTRYSYQWRNMKRVDEQYRPLFYWDTSDLLLLP